MTNKKTVSFAVDPLLIKKLTEFTESVNVTRSAFLDSLIKKFLYAHEKAINVRDPNEYITKTMSQNSYYCATGLGVMLTLNIDMDFVVQEQIK